jgi:hypothetical protein
MVQQRQNSQISLVRMLVMVQQMLITQIYWSECWARSVASNSNFFGQNAGEMQLVLTNQISLVHQLVRCNK